MRTQDKSKTYGQYCPLARALDGLGERWALLIVRDLLLGPKRYKDLLDGLPGIGTNLLARRLRELEAAGVVRRRRLPPPAARSVYELTERGRELEPIVLDLARWGLADVGERRPQEVVRPEWTLLGVRLLFDPEAARGLHEFYEFRIEDEVFHLCVDDGRAAVVSGPAEAPDVTLHCDSETALALASRTLRLVDAVKEGRVRLEGRPEALTNSGRVFGLAPR